MTSFTMAWIKTNEHVERVTIKTGEGKFELDAGIYHRQVISNLPATTVDSAPNYAPVIDEVNSTNQAIAFSFTNNFGQVDLTSMVLDEHALNAAILPSYVLELRAHTTIEFSYVRLSMTQQPYNGSPAVDFDLYTFQYLLVNNNVASPLDYAASANLSELENKPLNAFDGTNPVYFSEGTSNFNSYEIAVDPAQATFYETHFAKSILVLLRPDPLAFYNFLKTEQLSGTQTKKAGIRFQLYTEFSLMPFAA